MRLYEIEDLTSRYLEKIKDNCFPWISSLSKYGRISENLVYRGVNDVLTSPMAMTTYDYRQPSNTPTKVHMLMNKLMKRELGWGYRASEVVYATHDLSTAGSYGNEGIVFPIGNFSFCWSPTAADFFNVYRDYMLRHKLKDSELELQHVKEMYDQCRWTTSNLKQAISSGHEIMIHCKQYYIVPVNYFTETQLDSLTLPD